MPERIFCDCPIPACGAKCLVRLANHLTDVHMLDIDTKMYLQKAKLQSKVLFIKQQEMTKTFRRNKTQKNKTWCVNYQQLKER